MPDKEPDFLPCGEDSVTRELTGDRARQAVTIGHMRYVLGFGLFLAILLLTLIYFYGP